MNGHAYRPSADDYGMPPKSGIDPSGNVVVESYRQDIINGFEKEQPLYNPVGYQERNSFRIKNTKVDIANSLFFFLPLDEP